MKKIFLLPLIVFFLSATNTFAQVDYGACQTVNSGSAGPCFFGFFNVAIATVTFSDLHFTGGTCNDAGYLDLYSSSSGTVTTGQSYTFSVTRVGGGFPGTGTSGYAAWVDWNNDGDFADAGEEILAPTNTGSNAAVTTSVLVPISAVSGDHRMRVRSENNQAPTDPCANDSECDTKDFKIVVEGGVDCNLLIVPAQTNSNCGNANGAINLTVTGGSSPYTYQWSNLASTEDISNISAGTYTVTVKDAGGCSGIADIPVGGKDGPSLGETHVDATCGKSNGSIDITVTGGTSPFTYSWSIEANTEDLSNIPANKYLVNVTDANGCTAGIDVTVQDISGCQVPAGLEVDNTTATNATVSWIHFPCVYRNQVRYRQIGTSTWTTLTVGIGLNTKTITGLTPSTDYEFQVVANCGSGFTKWSASQNFSTKDACIPPTGIKTNAIYKTQANISWDAVPGAYSYQLAYRKVGGSTWIRKTILAPTTFKVITVLTKNTNYEYEMRTVCDASGKPISSWSSIQNFTTHARMEEGDLSISSDLLIYPNPNEGSFTIAFENNVEQTGSIEILNTIGQIVFSKEVNLTEGNNSISVQLNHISAGIYTVMMKTKSGNSIQKISVTKDF